MSPRRGATDLAGILAIDKPSGMTSHDVVGRVRHVTGERRVGHAGTLDPAATGLLVVLVGPATRLARYLTAAEKTYEARIAFGEETDTDDAQGRVVRKASVPQRLSDPDFAARTVADLVGLHDQVPPAYSAIKRGGVAAYEAARRGAPLALAPRAIEVRAARLLGVEPTDGCAWDVELTVSKGTYVRALARDLGRALGTTAHLAALRRTSSGALSVADAHTLEELADAEDVRRLFADPLQALGLRVVEIDAQIAERARTGAALTGDAEGLVALAHDGALLGVYAGGEGRLRPETVFPGCVRGHGG